MSGMTEPMLYDQVDRLSRDLAAAHMNYRALCEELITARNELNAARRETEEMREALRPFAVAVENYAAYVDNDTSVRTPVIRVGDIRAAARALSAQPDPHKEEPTDRNKGLTWDNEPNNDPPERNYPSPPSGLREALESMLFWIEQGKFDWMPMAATEDMYKAKKKAHALLASPDDGWVKVDEEHPVPRDFQMGDEVIVKLNCGYSLLGTHEITHYRRRPSTEQGG